MEIAFTGLCREKFIDSGYVLYTYMGGKQIVVYVGTSIYGCMPLFKENSSRFSFRKLGNKVEIILFPSPPALLAKLSTERKPNKYPFYL